MRFAAKFIGRLIFFVALMVNLFLVFLFFAPVSFLISMGYGEIEMLQKEAIPQPVADFMITNEAPLSLTREEPVSSFRQLVTKILEIRSQRFMNEGEALAIKLSLLDFGEGIIGLEKASHYYFNRPLREIGDEEWKLLVNLHQMFL